MPAIQKKSNKETFMDNTFVVFSQGYLIEQVAQWIKQVGAKKGYDGKNPPPTLDVGCYNGRLWPFMKERFIFTDYTGIDYQQKYLDNAFVKEGRHFKLHQADITEGLKFDDEAFELVLSSEVFEHIEGHHYPDLMNEIYRVLRPGGRAILGFPMNTHDHEYHSVEKEGKRLGHVNFPVHDDFIKLGESVGFKLLKFDSSYTTSSSYRIPKETKLEKFYEKVKNALGSNIARAVTMIVTDDHTGGGFYTFVKPGLEEEDNPES